MGFRLLKRYDKECLKGQKVEQKVVDYPSCQKKQVAKLRKELKEAANVGLQQVEELIIKKSGVKYPYTHIYSILRKWEFKQKVSRKVYVSIVTSREKEIFKKTE